MLACARIGAVHSVVFGGFAPQELATRIDDAKPKRDPFRLLRHRGRAGSSPTSRCSTRPSTGPPQARALHHPPAPAGEAALVPGRDIDWQEAVAGAARWSACRWPRPTRSTSSTPRARPGCPRAWCATTAATRSRSSGAWARLRRRPGRGVLGGLRHRLGGRPLLHRVRARCSRLHHHPLRGQAGGHARPRRVLAGVAPARGERAVHRAHRVPGDQEGGSRRASTWRATTSRASARSSWPASAAIPTRSSGRGAAARAGDRPLVADRDRLADRRNCVGLGMLPVKPGSPTKAVPGYDVRVLGDDGPRGAGGPDRRRSRSSCRCRRAACPRSGTTTRATSGPTSSSIPATT